jgi:surfeit locus 1 family protein
MPPSAYEPPHSRARLALWLLLLTALFAGFIALGSWQIHRRAWKLDLIAQVDRKLHAAPVPAPGRDVWAQIKPSDQYLKIQAEGTYLPGREVRVQAVTELGAGYWLISPLQTRDGFFILINRGFVDADWQAPPSQNTGLAPQPLRITGLLRLSEPKGGFLRHNDPATARWYSRDVAAIAASLQLPAADVAPYFIDADAAASPDRNPETGPVGGLTVVRFHNSHLVYAITWYTLAMMTLLAGIILARPQSRRHNQP